VLEEIATRTHGRVLTGAETGDDIFGVDRQARHKSQPIFDWLLIVLVCLVPLDVGLRRVQIDWSILGRRMGMFSRAAPSAKTFEALLDRKRAVSTALGPTKRGASRESEGAVEPVSSPPANPPAPPTGHTDAMRHAVEAARDQAAALKASDASSESAAKPTGAA